ncbi:hypothetical protein FHL15_008573 [Xylaria flabelliformis]|uniref:Uncharacterized protein n=1 Tax=Xylaria flabelliformis TaxID=2512241 RepID=A0A553HRM9_9PEZI|nr:hypothetical protein FHL15_008573 [Xylaria flabelliformis]
MIPVPLERHVEMCLLMATSLARESVSHPPLAFTVPRIANNRRMQVTAGFVVTGWLTVVIVLCYYVAGFSLPQGDPRPSGDSETDPPENRTDRLANRFDQTIVVTTRSLVHRGLAGLARSILAMCDIQIATGLGILISGYLSLCPQEGTQGALSSYHWHTIVSLAWLSSLTHQGGLIFLRFYFRKHRWQRNCRLILMATLLILLLVSMTPIAYFNWYHKRFVVAMRDLDGELLVQITVLGKSAAQPSMPAVCFFNLSRATSLFKEADPCPFSDIVIGDIGVHVRDNVYIPNGTPEEVYKQKMRELLCNHNATLLGTAALQSTIVGAVATGTNFLARVASLMDGPSDLFKCYIRQPLGRKCRCMINQISAAENCLLGRVLGKESWGLVVVNPLVALYLYGQLTLDFVTSEACSICLLLFYATLGTIRVFATYTPQCQHIHDDGWTFGQILAVILLLSPLMFVVLELFHGGSETWAQVHDRSEPLTQELLNAGQTGIELGSISTNSTQPQQADTRETLASGQPTRRPSSGRQETNLFDESHTRPENWREPAAWAFLSLVILFMSEASQYMLVSFNTPGTLSQFFALTALTFPVHCYLIILLGLSTAKKLYARPLMRLCAAVFAASSVVPSLALKSYVTVPINPVKVQVPVKRSWQSWRNLRYDLIYKIFVSVEIVLILIEITDSGALDDDIYHG